MNDEKCFVCGDKPENGQEGYSSALMTLPGLRKPVPVCGNCLIRQDVVQVAGRVERVVGDTDCQHQEILYDRDVCADCGAKIGDTR